MLASKPTLLAAIAVAAAGIAWLLTRGTSDDLPRCAPAIVAPPATPTPLATPQATIAPARACLGPRPHLAANQARPIVCSYRDACFAVDLASGALTNAKPVDTATREVPPVTHERGAWTVCRERACVRVGAQLHTVLDSFADPKLDATADLQAVIVEKHLAWSVPRDAPIALRTSRSGTYQTNVNALGNLLLAEWASCAGPCDKTTIHDSRGRAIGRPFDGTAQTLPIGRDRYVLGGVMGELTMIDSTGNQLASHSVETFSKWDFSPDLARVGSDEHPQLAVLRTTWDTHAVAIVSLFDLANDGFRLIAEHEFPGCPDDRARL